jgi:hypothetical protein
MLPVLFFSFANIDTIHQSVRSLVHQLFDIVALL